MLRRLGAQQAMYRAESPSQSLASVQSECSLPVSVSTASEVFVPRDELQLEEAHAFRDERRPTPPARLPEQRIVERPELQANLHALATKLGTVVALVNDFCADAVGMREHAHDLLEELLTRVHPSLVALDLHMMTSESLLKYNVDRANIKEHRIDWLLKFNRYLKEMRKILAELSGPVYLDLESSLSLRVRGVVGRRPSPETAANLAEMQGGMRRALCLLTKD